jgi:hypothetical protein
VDRRVRPPGPAGQLPQPHGYGLAVQRRAYRQEVGAGGAGRDHLTGCPAPGPFALDRAGDGVVVLHVIEDDQRRPGLARPPAADAPARPQRPDNRAAAQLDPVLPPDRPDARSVGVVAADGRVSFEFVADVPELILRLPGGVGQDEGQRLVPLQRAVEDVGQRDDGGLGALARRNDRLFGVASEL